MVCISGPLIIDDGLVLHLDAANTRSYPGTGTIWNDLSGNERNGSLLNSVGYNSTNSGVLTFDGVNDYFIVENYSLGEANTSFSFGGWAKVFSTGISNYFLFSNYVDDSSTAFFAIVLNNSMSTCYAWLRTPARISNTTSQISLNLNQWYYFTATRDSVNEELKFYVNDTLTSTVSCPASNAFKDTDSFYGGMKHSSGSWIQSQVGNTFMYNRALTAAEVKRNFQATRGRYGI